MSEKDPDRITKHVRCVGEIVAAYVTSNRLPGSDLPAIIASVADALAAMAARRSPSVSEALVRPTGEEIRKSITRDRLISFIDGKPYHALRRHLRFHGHTAESYRSRYGLPVDYPMVSTSYSKRRTEISRQLAARNRG